LKIRYNAGNPIICWTWKYASTIEIRANRGIGFVLFSVYTDPETLDALPATKSSWKQKAIYRLYDAPVSQLSDVINVTVGG
jgi:hypothetical protein